MRLRLKAAACGLVSCFVSSAWAASDADLAAIREEIRQLKASYEARIQALERRLKDAEAKGAAPAPVPAPAPTAATTPRASSTNLAAFNPAISAILSGQYANLSRDPGVTRPRGFANAAGIGPEGRGFSLAESELVFSANVDHKFFGNLVLAVSPEDTISVEEAYGIYSGAPLGIVPKLGRFLSGLGYLNEQHAHAWDFVDTPLAYQAFLGGQYRNDGLQLRWVAPFDHYVELGAEVGSGESFPGTARGKNGTNSGVVFARTGGDIGASHSWRVGASFLRTRAEGRAFDARAVTGEDVPLAFTGRSNVAVADFVWKYAPHGNPRETNLKLQGEYFRARERGEVVPVAIDSAVTEASSFSARQSGWYVQGVYQWMPMWRVGLRYDRLDPGDIDFGANAPFIATFDFHPKRATAMVDWSPSEFSRVRLQFAQSKTVQGATDTQWFLQYILSIGAHGAHKY